jgi:hypothetical protein
MYNGDTDRIRVKKWFIASPKVLSDSSIYILDFFLFERACSDAVPMRALNLLYHSFEKDSFIDLKPNNSFEKT